MGIEIGNSIKWGCLGRLPRTEYYRLCPDFSKFIQQLRTNVTNAPCHLSHMGFFFFLFVFCADLKDFCTGYFTIMSTVLGANWQPCPLIEIFRIPDSSQLNSTQMNIIGFDPDCKTFIIVTLMSVKYPFSPQWLKDMIYFLKFDFKYTLRRSTDKKIFAYGVSSWVGLEWDCLLFYF